jgi:tetratricopeptide (TPR) repeat protein
MKAPYVLLALAALAQAQPNKEDPVGLILIPGGARLLRAETETPLAARAGDILFAGDALRTQAAPATFLFCPAKVSQTLAPSSEVVLTTGQLKAKSGRLDASKPVSSCFLPQVVRVAAASQQHYGVSLTRGLQKPPEPTLIPPEKFTPEAAAELAPIEKALAADASDQAALVARSAVFEKHKLYANALADYKKIGGQFADAVWVKGKIFELEELLANQAAQAAAAPLGGKMYALLVGVSEYQKLPKDLWLQYAHADAEVFASHLSSGRGGKIPQDDMIVLTNQKATTAALRNAFQTFIKGRAGKTDTVLILIAGHGTVEVPGSKGAFILTHDSDPQDLASTALPMADVQELVEEQLTKVGRVAVFVDVCRAGVIGTIRSTTVNAVVERLADAEGEIFGLMASRPKELSYEGPQFGGGHGAFSYALLKALNGDADKNKDQIVNVNEIIEYVRDTVATLTNDKQHPRDFGTMDNAVPLADLKQPGIQLAHFPFIFDSAGGPLYLAAAAQQPPVSDEMNRAIQRFQDALAAGRLLPDVAGSAFEALRGLSSLPPERYVLYENQLRIALENRAQQVLLRYLTGDEVPQTQADFQAGARYVDAARRLTPESLFLEARREFFEGRAILFDKNFSRAGDLLEQAIRMDPAGAYGYNALGIAYLEQGDFDRSIPAFRDAIRLAPHWAYPRHNLALAYVETGEYNGAIRAYQDAMRIAPNYMYLPYNLGLVYQRLNRRKDAERSYRRAMALSPDSAEPYNALGSLKASQGRRSEAEDLYKQALAKDPKLLAARHNLALLLSEEPARRADAVALWQQNLAQDSEHLPSRLALAETLAQTDARGAAEQYRQVLALRPEYVAARIALAGLLMKLGDSDGARRELDDVVTRDAANSSAWERIGDLEASRGRAAEAESAYQKALETAPDGAARKRIRKKVNP